MLVSYAIHMFNHLFNENEDTKRKAWNGVMVCAIKLFSIVHRVGQSKDAYILS